MSKKEPFYYGWIVVAACFVATLGVGEVMWSFGVFFTSFEADFGWSRSLISGGYTFLIVGHSVSAIIAGKLADRNAARPTLLTSALLGGIAIVLCSRIQTPVHLYALFLIAGLGTGATISIPNSTVQRWFENRPRSGVALATVMTGIGIGGLLFAPLFRYLISSLGWRATFVVAGIMFCLMVGLAGALRRPYAAMAHAPLSQASTLPTASRSMWQMVRSTRFLALLGITFAAFLAFQVTTIHLVPYAADIGLSPTIAAVALGLIGGASVPGRFLSGFLSERFGWGRTLAGALLGAAIAIMALTLVSQDWMLIAVVALFGVCHGMRAVAVMGLLGRFFGTAALGELIGITIAAGQLMSAPGPYVAGYWYDLGNSYDLMFTVLAAALALSAVLVVSIASKTGVRGLVPHGGT